MQFTEFLNQENYYKYIQMQKEITALKIDSNENISEIPNPLKMLVDKMDIELDIKNKRNFLQNHENNIRCIFEDPQIVNFQKDPQKQQLLEYIKNNFEQVNKKNKINQTQDDQLQLFTLKNLTPEQLQRKKDFIKQAFDNHEYQINCNILIKENSLQLLQQISKEQDRVLVSQQTLLNKNLREIIDIIFKHYLKNKFKLDFIYRGQQNSKNECIIVIDEIPVLSLIGGSKIMAKEYVNKLIQASKILIYLIFPKIFLQISKLDVLDLNDLFGAEFEQLQLDETYKFIESKQKKDETCFQQIFQIQKKKVDVEPVSPDLSENESLSDQIINYIKQFYENYHNIPFSKDIYRYFLNECVQVDLQDLNQQLFRKLIQLHEIKKNDKVEISVKTNDEGYDVFYLHSSLNNYEEQIQNIHNLNQYLIQNQLCLNFLSQFYNIGNTASLLMLIDIISRQKVQQSQELQYKIRNKVRKQKIQEVFNNKRREKI